MTSVAWKVNGIFKASAEKVYEEIQDIGEQISPADVLEKAKNPDTELHKCFEWNNDIAAEKYRLQQAGNIIRMLVYEPESKEQQTVRVLSITNTVNTYQPTKAFLTMSDEYSNLLKRAKAELEAFKRKYNTLSELEPVFEALELI